MTAYDLLIRNAKVATAADTFTCEIGIRDGKIAALADHVGDAIQIIDAAGRWVLPGGIDTHVHIAEPPLNGASHADDFDSGTRSAACGGTTAIMPFALQRSGESLRTIIEDYHAKADGKALIDYAFHTILVDPTEQVTGQEIPALIRDGYTSFKLYMRYDDVVLNDRQILDVLDVARHEGAMVMIHAENNACIHFLSDKLAREGGGSLADYAKSSPMPVEREATHRAISLAEVVDTPILLVHVSAHEAMEQIRWAQQRSLKVFAETCPQYLVLDDTKYASPGWEPAKFLCAPPPRHKGNQEELWRGLSTGVFHVVSSDHTSFLFDSPEGKKIGGANKPRFDSVPPGFPGIEVRLPLLFSEGVRKGRISINQFVALTATNAAKIYGLYPRKGTIAVGTDADLAIWNEDRTVTIRHEMLHDNVDFTPYEGMTVTGWPDLVLSRGEIVVEDGEICLEAGRGAYLRCVPVAPTT